ncbi:MAG: hypothetical protein CVT98_00495 [Bacteroidetes bacterium HGW-Bacteroidetes-15]|nr:MAG: hypothetical protein CVT98_00495 [Bacteroidetes bacterium HGW-Bacteroidetes-15]
MVIIDLIYNLSTLVALSIISGFVYYRWRGSTDLGAVLQGLLFGIVAILGMLNPLVLSEGLVFDGRSVVISLCALFFGPVAGVISAVMAVLLRVYQGGIGTIMGVSVISASAVIGIIYHYRRKQRDKRITSLFLIGFGLIVHAVMLALTFTLPYEAAISVIKNIGYAIILFYPLATLLIGKILHDQEIKIQSVEALRKSESLFRSLAQSSPVGICKVESNGIITFVNDRWCDMVGVSCSSILGNQISIVVHPSDKYNFISIWKEQEAKAKTFSIEFRVNKRNNETFWLLGQFEPNIDEFGNIIGFVGSIFDIDERKKNEAELRRWESIFKHTRMGIVLGMAGTESFDLINPAFAQMHGYTVEELIGKPIQVVFAPEEIKRIPEEIKKGFEKGYHVYESWHVKKDGSRFPVLTSITAVKDMDGNPLYRIVNIQDITERFEAEKKLRSEQYRLENIIEGTNVGVWEWNVQTGHTLYNERWASMIGYTLSEIAPPTVNTWLKFLHPEDEPKAISRINKHFDRETEFYECEFRMKHKDGHWVWIQDRGRVAQWTSDGKPFMMFGVHIDITERKRWEESLKISEQQLKEQNERYIALNEELIDINKKLSDSEKRLKEQNEEYHALNEELLESNQRISTINEELEIARKRAEESDKLKSAFLANMSHEIRTPMNAILGFSEILVRPNLAKEKQTLYAEVLNAASNQLLGIINDILDISKIETGQVTIHEGEVSLNQILRTVQSIFIQNAKNKGNTLVISPTLPDDKCLVHTDESKITQIITNLVSNAIKFTDNGRIEIGYSVSDSQLKFFVEDTGIGISEENQGLIFDRFRQADMAPNRNYGGTGLGLSICKAFVEMLGGDISVDSVFGQGSKFNFTVPYKPIIKSKTEYLAKAKAKYDFSRVIVLVAEDEPNNFFFLKELLNETGVKIIHAENGARAVELFGLNPNIKLILMDIKMPVLNGIDATKMIRTIDSKIPIIALTAYAMAGDKENCLAAGCSSYLSKPIIKDDLLSTIALYLNKGR